MGLVGVRYERFLWDGGRTRSLSVQPFAVAGAAFLPSVSDIVGGLMSWFVWWVGWMVGCMCGVAEEMRGWC